MTNVSSFIKKRAPVSQNYLLNENLRSKVVVRYLLPLGLSVTEFVKKGEYSSLDLHPPMTVTKSSRCHSPCRGDGKTTGKGVSKFHPRLRG